jgi:hypothetical protein
MTSQAARPGRHCFSFRLWFAGYDFESRGDTGTIRQTACGIAGDLPARRGNFQGDRHGAAILTTPICKMQ